MKNKKVFWSFGVIFFVFGILYWLGIIGFWAGNIADYFKERGDQRYLQELENKSAELERLYKEDPYGGDTPEETLALFVDALEKEDIELASRYFVVEKQEDMTNVLNQAFESGGAESLVDYYNNGKTKTVCYDYINTCDLSVTKDSTPGFYLQLILNKETNKWKILDL